MHMKSKEAVWFNSLKLPQVLSKPSQVSLALVQQLRSQL